MSRINKVNKDHYVQRGRLTPDEAARARRQQAQIAAAGRGLTAKKPRPRAPAANPPRSAPEE